MYYFGILWTPLLQEIISDTLTYPPNDHEILVQDLSSNYNKNLSDIYLGYIFGVLFNLCHLGQAKLLY